MCARCSGPTGRCQCDPGKLARRPRHLKCCGFCCFECAVRRPSDVVIALGVVESRMVVVLEKEMVMATAARVRRDALRPQDAAA